MSAVASESTDVHVERVYLDVRVPREHPEPELVRIRLEDAVQRHLESSLAAALPAAPESDQSVWLIRRLDVDLTLDVGADRHAAASTIAQSVSARLGKLITAGADGADVLRFSDRASYLAHFLGDLAEGRAWSRWYYRAFEGLKMLPVSAAVRTALDADPDLGQQALLCLDRASRDSVLRAMGHADLGRVLDALATTRGGPGDRSRAAYAAWAAWADAGPPPARREAEAAHALRLYLAVLDDRPDEAGGTLREMALALSRLACCVDERTAADVRALVAALCSGDEAIFYQAAGASDAERLAPLQACSAAWIERVAAELGDLQAGHVQTRDSVGDGTAATEHGGAFLLLPALDRLPLAEACRGWPDHGGVACAGLLRLVLLMKAMGTDRAQAVCADPVMRAAVGLPDDVSRQAIGEWLNHIRAPLLKLLVSACTAPQWADHIVGKAKEFEVTGPIPEGTIRPDDLAYLALPPAMRVPARRDRALSAVAAAMLRDFAGRLPGFGSSSIRYLGQNFLSAPATVETADATWTVHLGRPPLDVILNIAGQNRQSYAPSWLGGLTIRVFPAE